MRNFIQPVALIILRKNDKFLLTLRAEKDAGKQNYHGYWQIPGGGLEFGESVEACAIREAQEELGITVTVTSMLPKIFHDVRGRWHGILMSFLCEKKATDEIVLNDESSDYGWFTLEEAKKLKLMPLCEDILMMAAAS